MALMWLHAHKLQAHRVWTACGTAEICCSIHTVLDMIACTAHPLSVQHAHPPSCGCLLLPLLQRIIRCIRGGAAAGPADGGGDVSGAGQGQLLGLHCVSRPCGKQRQPAEQTMCAGCWTLVHACCLCRSNCHALPFSGLTAAGCSIGSIGSCPETCSAPAQWH